MTNLLAQITSDPQFRQFKQVAITLLAGIVCFAAILAACVCFFGEELRLLKGFRAVIVAGLAGAGSYYSYRFIPRS